MPPTLYTVEPKSPLLTDVIALSDANKKHLGFFPRDAFRRAAEKEYILAATAPKTGDLVGYVLFNVATTINRAVLQHLCVAAGSRRTGVGEFLVDALKRRTRHLSGISLHCARGFPAHKIWPKFGFISFGEKPGRGKDRKTLTRFWFDHNHPDLFSAANNKKANPELRVVMDSNVFFDLHINPNQVDEEIRILDSDWLRDDISLEITDEVFTEITRRDDPDDRKRARNIALSIPSVTCDEGSFRKRLEFIKNALPHFDGQSDQSDLNHLARTSAAGRKFFLTRDKKLLRERDCIRDTLDVNVLQPVELALHLDEVRRQADYAPRQLAASRMQTRPISAEMVSSIATDFEDSSSAETKSAFSRRLHQSLANPMRASGKAVFSSEGEPVAFLVIEHERRATRRIKFLRCTRHALAPTVLRHLIAEAILRVGTGNYGFVEISDEYVSQPAIAALAEFGFRGNAQSSAKLNLKGCLTLGEVEDRLRSIGNVHGEKREALKTLMEEVRRASDPVSSSEEVASVERRLSPLFLLDERIQNTVVPIKPRWARELYDEELAREMLLPVDERLALGYENVYYRSGHIPMILSPGHVFWYTSEGDARESLTKAVRAWSRVDEVCIGEPRELFRKFRRLGVYKWADVERIAVNSRQNRVEAFLFSGTQMVERRVGRSLVDKIHERHLGKVPPLSMPLKIPLDCAKEIYDKGSQGSQHEEQPL